MVFVKYHQYAVETGVIDQKARAVVTEIGGGGSGTYSRRAFRRLTQNCMERF